MFSPVHSNTRQISTKSANSADLKIVRLVDSTPSPRTQNVRNVFLDTSSKINTHVSINVMKDLEGTQLQDGVRNADRINIQIQSTIDALIVPIKLLIVMNVRLI